MLDLVDNPPIGVHFDSYTFIILFVSDVVVLGDEVDGVAKLSRRAILRTKFTHPALNLFLILAALKACFCTRPDQPLLSLDSIVLLSRGLLEILMTEIRHHRLLLHLFLKVYALS